MEQAFYDEALGLHKQHHRGLFPLSADMLAIFLSTAELSQHQRQGLASIMTRRNRTIAQYRVDEWRDIFIKLFCTMKTPVDNPMMNP